MSITTSAILSFNYLKVKEKKNVVSFHFFSFIVFEGENELIMTVEGELRVFQSNFYEKSLSLTFKELEKQQPCKNTSHR